jgi:hypothetical protein
LTSISGMLFFTFWVPPWLVVFCFSQKQTTPRRLSLSMGYQSSVLNSYKPDPSVSEISDETKSEGLGFSFLVELEGAIDQVLANPEAYQRVGGEVRRKRFRRFPYNLLSSN